MIHQGKAEIEFRFFEKWWKSTIVFSTGGVILKGITTSYWAILILFHFLVPALRYTIFCNRGKSWGDEMSVESPILCTPALWHRLRPCLQQQKSMGVRAALPEVVLPLVLLNNQPLLERGCKNGAQHSPKFIPSLIASPSLSSAFDGSDPLGAVSTHTVPGSLLRL